MGFLKSLGKIAKIAGPVASVFNPGVGAALTLGGTLLGGDGGGKIRGTESKTSRAAPWEPDMRYLWNEFMRTWKGETRLSPYASVPHWFDPVYYLKKRPDVAKFYHIDPDHLTEQGAARAFEHYRRYGRKEGTPPNVYAERGEALPETPSVEELVEQDIEAKKVAGERYLEDLGDILKGYEGRVSGLWGETGGALSRAIRNLSAPDVVVKLGNFGVPIVSAPRRRAAVSLADVASEKTQRGLSLFDRLLKEKQALEAQQLAQETQYTPATSRLKYLSMVQPIATSFNTLRYGLPSTTVSGSIPVPETPLLSQLAGGLSLVGEAARIGREFDLGGGLSRVGNWLDRIFG